MYQLRGKFGPSTPNFPWSYRKYEKNTLPPTCLNSCINMFHKRSLVLKKKCCKIAIRITWIIYRLRMTNRCHKLRNLMTNIETGKYSDISDVEAAKRELSIIFQALPSVPPNAQVYMYKHYSLCKMITYHRFHVLKDEMN